uniref:PGG domain-containing protein n=1 Tax=Oryza punctata TaxID=4537 RepID=A0A0E0LAN1_ORYPU
MARVMKAAINHWPRDPDSINSSCHYILQFHNDNPMHAGSGQATPFEGSEGREPIIRAGFARTDTDNGGTDVLYSSSEMERNNLQPTGSSQATTAAAAMPVTMIDDNRTWQLQKYLMLLTILVATVTYIAGLNPPGGVWLETKDGHLTGNPILPDTQPIRHFVFYYFNATAFVVSLMLIPFLLQPSEKVAVQLKAVRVAMLADLVLLMVAYIAGCCPDRPTTIFTSLLSAVIFGCVIVHSLVAPSSKGQLRLDKPNKVLMLLAIFVATVTYTAGMRPPGGTWEHAQEAGRSDAGEPIWLERRRLRFMAFLISNTIALVASLAVVMLILSSRLRRSTSCLALHVFLTMALLGLLGAYVSGSCTEWIFTVQVGCVAGAAAVILLYVSCLPIVEVLFDGFKSQHHSLLGAPGRGVTIISLVPIVPVREGEPIMARTPCLPGTTPTESTMVVHSSEAHVNPLDNGRSMILLLATLTATVTYQAGLDPPGGVWRDSEGGHKGGDLILLTTHAIRYKVFFYCNSAAFMSSIIVVIMVQSKDLVNRCALHAAVILDLLGLMGAYAAGSWRDIGASISIFVLVAAINVLFVVTYIVSYKSLTRGNNGSVPLAEQERKRELQKRQKLLLNLAVLAITVTYQAGLTPPGGFWIGHADEEHHNGDPVLGDNYRGWYTSFFFCNTTSFMASVVTIVFLVSQSLSEIDMAYCRALYFCVSIVLAGLVGAFACGTSQRMQESMYVLGLASLGFTLAIPYIHRSHPMVRNGDSSDLADDAVELADDVVTNDQYIKRHKLCKYLMLIGILAATITYQAGLTPPGNVWPAADDGEGHAAGDPILRDSDRRHYLSFLYSNSASFVASVIVIVLLLRGMVRKLGFFLPPIWVVHAVTVVDLLALLVAYAMGSSRDQGTSVYVVAVAATVLVYIAIYVGLSSRRGDREQGDNGGISSHPSSQAARV